MLTVHAAGIAVLPFTSLLLWVQLFVLPVTGLSLHWHWARHVTRRRANVQSITWMQDRDCVIINTAGTTARGVLLPAAFVMPWLVILHLRVGRRRHSLFLLPDMLPATTFRRLRVRLRIQSVPTQPHLTHGR